MQHPVRQCSLLVLLSLGTAALASAQERPVWMGPPIRLPPLPEEVASQAAAEPEALPPPTAEEGAPPQPAPEEITADPGVAAADSEDAKVILEEPGWHVWQPWFWDTSYWDPWEGSVELGLSGTEGNSETFNVRAGLKAKHTTPRLARTVELTSIQKSAAGVTTANTALLDGRLEWPMPDSRWNYYMHGLVEYDQFKAFEYRVSADTGFGYEFIQNPATTLMGRAGLSASQEIGGSEDELIPELALGGEFKHKFNPTHSIHAKVDYFPDVTDFNDFRLNSQAGWQMALSSAWGLSLKLSVIDRYDSTPQGRKPNDLDYSTLLLWQF
jgi:putative salt-induced outer membrane protein YdiY